MTQAKQVFKPMFNALSASSVVGVAAVALASGPPMVRCFGVNAAYKSQ